MYLCFTVAYNGPCFVTIHNTTIYILECVCFVCTNALKIFVCMVYRALLSNHLPRNCHEFKSYQGLWYLSYEVAIHLGNLFYSVASCLLPMGPEIKLQYDLQCQRDFKLKGKKKKNIFNSSFNVL
jgi:hypothetical protein